MRESGRSERIRTCVAFGNTAVADAAQGEIGAVELAEQHIRQIERLNPQLNAFADFDAERVRAQARGWEQCAAIARLFTACR